MKIGLISDTHNPSVGRVPPPEVAIAFNGVDAILHAGDIYIPACLDWLEEIAPVYAVEYVDDPQFQEDPRVINKVRVLELGGHTIGLVHDLIVPGVVQELTERNLLSQHFPADADFSDALQSVFGSTVDIVVFGHTHYAVIEDFRGTLLVNPGSPSLPKHMRRLGQVAVLDLGPDEKSVEMIELSTLS